MARRPYSPKIRVFGAPTDANSAHIFASGGHESNPADHRGEIQTRWAAEHLGMQSYSLLTGYAYFAVPQRLQSLSRLWEEAERLIAEGDPPTWAVRERLSMIQWEYASQVCMMVEELAALTTAVDGWRETGADIATTYLGWKGDIATTIADPRWTDPNFWLRLVAYPGHQNLQGLGMTKHEARAYSAAVDATVAGVVRGVGAARAFMTPEMRRVYARFKHGFSLVNPLSTPVAIDVELAPKAAASTLGGSLLVIDQSRKGSQVLLAMRVSGYDLSGLAGAASAVSGAAMFIAACTVEGARSEERRGMVLTTPDLTPLPEEVQHAADVYIGLPRGAGSYHRRWQNEVVRLQHELQAVAEEYRTPPLPLPAPMR